MRVANVALVLFIAACGSSSDAVAPAVTPDGGGSGDSSTGGGDGSGSEDAGIIVPDAAPGPDGGLLMFDGALPPPPPPLGAGRTTFKLNGKWQRLLATVGSQPEDLSTPMDKISAGTDNFLDTAKDGQWLVAMGSRFGCGSGSCVELFAGDLSAGSEIKIAGKVINSGDARPVVSSGATVIVYAATGGPHSLDLYATTHNSGTWSAPVLLTNLSTYKYHHDAAISGDGSRVVFDCGADQYGAPPTAICEVGTDGNGFHTVIDPADGPDKSPNHAAHHADYAPDGSVVFEVDWPGEQIWKLPVAGGSPVNLSGAAYADDNSPCVLPDGRIISLWLGRSGNTSGGHEIKVMNGDGTSPSMLLTGVDVTDIGMGCGN